MCIVTARVQTWEQFRDFLNAWCPFAQMLLGVRAVPQWAAIPQASGAFEVRVWLRA